MDRRQTSMIKIIILIVLPLLSCVSILAEPLQSKGNLKSIKSLESANLALQQSIKASEQANTLLQQSNETLMHANDALRQSQPLRNSIEETKEALDRTSRQTLANHEVTRMAKREIIEQMQHRSLQDRLWDLAILAGLLALTFALVWRDHQRVEARQEKSFHDELRSLRDVVLSARVHSLDDNQQAAKERTAERAKMSDKMDKAIASNEKQIESSNHFNEKLRFAKAETEERIVQIDANTVSTKLMVEDMHEKRS